MTGTIEFTVNLASEEEIFRHIEDCDARFLPVLSGRVNLSDYAARIRSRAIRVEAWTGDLLVGLLAVYCNDQQNRLAYITSVSVLDQWTGKGIASRLLKDAIKQARQVGMRRIRLEVGRDNQTAIRLYKKFDFVEAGREKELLIMTREL